MHIEMPDVTVIDEFHLKILAPNTQDFVLQVFVSAGPHPRFTVGDRVENMIVNRPKLPSGGGMVVTCVHHSVDTHSGKIYMTTRLETDVRPNLPEFNSQKPRRD